MVIPHFLKIKDTVVHKSLEIRSRLLFLEVKKKKKKKKISHTHVVYDIKKKQIIQSHIMNWLIKIFKSHREPVCESFSSCGTPSHYCI